MEKVQILRNSNFLDILEDARKLDTIVVSDPPYNIDFKYASYDDNKSDDDYIEMLSKFKGMRAVLIQYPEETMKYLVPALGVPDEVFAWCYNSNLSRHFRLVNFYNLTPDRSKVKQPYKNPNDKRIKKLIENGSEGTPIYDWFSDIQMVKNVSKEKTIHPCPIPEKLIERILLTVAKKNDIIFDPFMGCGTVPYVAKCMNLQYIGTEIDETYYDEAVKRLRGY